MSDLRYPEFKIQSVNQVAEKSYLSLRRQHALVFLRIDPMPR
ncbi:hypothetical protein ALQ72_01482 [Pseudomonas syringae pv. maculicola]|uniref:Uncharacterized protein n=1 Tax=Pseudomonas syringae pv. maculicola TaxID=59511 RepID=A0A0N0G208_PSEYM|nr:Unknown protein sequence [Pseudomonas syringae pv. maculicola]RMM82403.1 hypothetical protein ALQ72_01482 [Pseudomonas syringae pv. maculicola]RMV43734.1 hypothetical protein ALP13_01398 [Pseudomonas syringae pv. maculicola]